MTAVDKALGASLLLFAAVLLAYYTAWVFAMVRAPSSERVRWAVAAACRRQRAGGAQCVRTRCEEEQPQCARRRRFPMTQQHVCTCMQELSHTAVLIAVHRVTRGLPLLHSLAACSVETNSDEPIECEALSRSQTLWASHMRVRATAWP